MSDLHLDAALALTDRLRLDVRESEETRDLQRAAGGLLPKSERRLLERRRALAAACLEASRLCRDAGLPATALALVREYAHQDNLVCLIEGRLEAQAARRVGVTSDPLQSGDEPGR